MNEAMDAGVDVRRRSGETGAMPFFAPGGLPVTVIDILREKAEAFPDRPAVIDGGRTLTHAQLWDRVDRLGAAMAALGARPGDVVMAWLPNVGEAIEAELAALQSGLVWVSLNARFTWPEAADVMADCAPRLLITDAERLGRARAALAAEAVAVAVEPERAPSDPIPPLLGHLPDVIVTRAEKEAEGEAEASSEASIDPSAPRSHGLHSYEALLAAAEPVRPRVQIHDTTIARLRYTSGTTGRPKAAILPHRVYMASLENLTAELHALGPDDRALHAAPLTHATSALVFPILAAGGANVIMDKFDAAEALERIERLRITTVWLAPTMLQRLAEVPDFATRDLTSLRTIMYGGAPTPVEKLAPLLPRLGPALVQIFGMTEAPFPITTLRRGEHRPGSTKLGSIGKPTAMCQVRIVDEAGRIAPDGEVGELLVRGRNVMDGYWRDEAETRKALRDGWLHTGDLARRDAEGFLWIVDRKKDVIISGGFNVYAAEVEAALQAHADVAEAAVVGRPHPDWGEMVVACVVARPGARLSPADLDLWLRARLAPYKLPKLFEFRPNLPRTATGKVLKRELAGSGS